MADAEKTYEQKNIKFFYDNAEDKKILDFFIEQKSINKKVKFGTIVKELLLQYIEKKESSNEESKPGINVQITKEEVSKMIKQALKEFIAEDKEKSMDLDINAKNELSVSDIKQTVGTDKKNDKNNSKPNLLKQLKIK